MQCGDAHEKFDLLLLGDLCDIEYAALQRHCQSCARCLAEYKKIQKMAQDIKNAVTPDDRADSLAEKICVKIARQVTHEKKTAAAFAFWRPFIRGIAAILAISFAAGWHFSNRKQPQGPFAFSKKATAFERQWQVDGLRSIALSAASAPVSSKNTVYALSPDKPVDRVIAIDIATGVQRWVSQSGAYGFLAADESYVYAATSLGGKVAQLSALGATDGKTRWRYTFTHTMRAKGNCAPVIHETVVYWVTASGVHAIDARTGKALWVRPLPVGSRPSQPSISRDLLYVAAHDALLEIDIKSGAPARNFAYPREMSKLHRPLCAVSDGLAVVAHREINQSGALICYDLSSGAIAWENKNLGVYHMAMAKGTIFTRSHAIRAINAATGAQKWVRYAGGCSPITIEGNRLLYVEAGDQDALVSIDSRNGELIARHPLENSCTGIHIARDFGFINTNEGVLYAVRSAWRG